jgi:hypothetical protein
MEEVKVEDMEAMDDKSDEEEIKLKNELELFIESLEGKSKATITQYTRQYKNLRTLIDKDIVHASQKKLIEASESATNLNTKQALLNIAILVRRHFDYDVGELINKRTKNKDSLIAHVKKTNSNLDLPTLNDLQEHMEKLFLAGKFKEFIINYLLINYNVRNEDLVFDIVNLKRDTEKIEKDAEVHKNYMWLSKKKATYYRRMYKTADTYGLKKNVITDKEFLLALAMVQKEGWDFTPDTIGYWVQKATINKIGEGAYMKILVNAHKGDLTKLKEISENRGTTIQTIATSYNLNL